MKLELKKLIKPAFIFGILASIFSLLISITVGEYIIKHTTPQNTYNFARGRGMNIFARGENIPLTLQKNVKDFHHIGYTLEFDHYVSTNSYGIRGQEISPQKGENTYKILLLGDSMTFGWGVDEEETFAKLIENNLNSWAQANGNKTKFEVINAAFTNGKTLDSYYIFLKETGLKFNPDLIILNYFPYNDILDLLEMNWDSMDENGLPTKISSKIQKIEDGYIINIYNQNWKYKIPLLRNSHLAIMLMTAMENGSPQLVQKIKNVLKIPQNGPREYTTSESDTCLSTLSDKLCIDEISDSYQTSKKLISKMAQIAQQEDSQFLVTILVDPEQVKKNIREEKTRAEISDILPQKDIRSFLENENILYLDFLRFFSTPQYKGYFFERDGHLQPAGHKLVSDYLSILIKRNYFEKLNIPYEFLEKTKINPNFANY